MYLSAECNSILFRRRDIDKYTHTTHTQANKRNAKGMKPVSMETRHTFIYWYDLDNAYFYFAAIIIIMLWMYLSNNTYIWNCVCVCARGGLYFIRFFGFMWIFIDQFSCMIRNHRQMRPSIRSTVCWVTQPLICHLRASLYCCYSTFFRCCAVIWNLMLILIIC